MKNIEKLLQEEIVSEIRNLEDLEMGSEDYTKSVDGLVKLMDRAIELEKFEADKAKEESSFDLKVEQLEHEKKDSKIRNYLTAAGIVVPSVITIWGVLKSFEFEQTGTVTTAIGRGFINKLLPKK